MGKKKNKNKVSGAVKTAVKTEKKLASKLKKELANLGEEDIAKVIAEIEREEAKRATAVEKNLLEPPTARAYATLTPHPTKDELIMFGGEYHDGQKTLVYNDLLFYNPATNSWKKVKAPGAPPPRSAHQAVTTSANKGELWVFGGEFTSPSETQFYHYKDLWCFNISDKKWEKVVAPNGPSARSGHRMVQLGRKLYVFGGYNDDGRECRYFDDLYSFCLESRSWSRVEVSGRGPAPRSACVMLPHGNDSLLIYGGFSRLKEGRTERAYTHTDMFRLVHKNGAWSWKALGAGGIHAPPSRAGQSATVNVQGTKGYVFGGVTDVVENEEELVGEMCDSLLVLDLESAKWHPVTLRNETAQNHPTTAPADDAAATQSCEDVVTVVTDEVFTMRVGGASVASPAAPRSDVTLATSTGPSPRMSAMMTSHRSTLYVYGGVKEKDDRQYYLSDMYSLDLHKLNEWQTLITQPKLPDWLGSSDSESGSETGSESEQDSDTDDD